MYFNVKDTRTSGQRNSASRCPAADLSQQVASDSPSDQTSCFSTADIKCCPPTRLCRIRAPSRNAVELPKDRCVFVKRLSSNRLLPPEIFTESVLDGFPGKTKSVKLFIRIKLLPPYRFPVDRNRFTRKSYRVGVMIAAASIVNCSQLV